jgi:hypothetical protein
VNAIAQHIDTAPRRYRGDLAARSFDVTEMRPIPGDMYAHLPWRIRLHGHGHWCVAEGNVQRHPTHAAAIAAGERWLHEGRTS